MPGRAAGDPVLRFRLAAQHLTAPAVDGHAVAADWSLQDSPPGTAAMALGARVAGFEPADLARALLEDRTLVKLYNARTATAVVPAAELRAFGAALLPGDEDGLRALLANAIPPAGEGTGPAEAVQRTGEAVREALDGAVLSRDDLHEHLRRRLPEDLLPWCKGCQSHHARRYLLVAACLRGELCLAGTAGRQPAFARPDQWLPEAPGPADPEAAAAELVRRFLRACGPATPALLAEWAGIPRAHARWAWGLVANELVAAPEGGELLAADAGALDAAPEHRGVVLLPPGDPLLLARDRDRLVADPGRRKALWRGITPPGAVLADGAVAGLWRGRKQGRDLEVTVEAWASIDRAALQAAAERVAALRGARSATVQI